MNTSTPYANLHPDVILSAIESVGIPCNGSLLALNSYENRVYQIGVEDAAPVIVKFYRPGRWSNAAILEEHQFALELAQHEIPVVAPLLLQDQTLHTYLDFRFAVFPRQGGRAFEADNTEQLEWMGRFIGRIHAIGSCQPFQHRITLNAQTYGHGPYQFLLENNFIPDELKREYCETVEALLQKIENVFAEVGTIKQLRLHGDCHPGNILWNPQGPQIVDLDDCLMGPAIQDIWMLLSGHTRQEWQLPLDYILCGYEAFYDFDYRELRLIAAFRSLRMIHYSAWLAKRWQDPAFPLNFPWFNTLHYWREQIENLRQQALLYEALE